eukprot:15045452-Alexandrium_andersonii.AAC.1
MCIRDRYGHAQLCTWRSMCSERCAVAMWAQGLNGTMTANVSFSEDVGRHAFRRQRVVAEAPRPSSRLASLLQEHFAWGLISAPVMQAFAQAAVDDGLQHADIKALSRIGAH